MATAVPALQNTLEQNNGSVCRILVKERRHLSVDELMTDDSYQAFFSRKLNNEIYPVNKEPKYIIQGTEKSQKKRGTRRTLSKNEVRVRARCVFISII